MDECRGERRKNNNGQLLIQKAAFDSRVFDSKSNEGYNSSMKNKSKKT